MSAFYTMLGLGLAALLIVFGRLSCLPKLRRLRRELATAVDRADHDPLTGLPNRRHAEALMSARLVSRQPTMTVLVDLNLFKQVNDTYGHAVGDQLLMVVAKRLQAAAREGDGFAARLGGDEFVLVRRVNGAHIDARGEVADELAILAAVLCDIEHPAQLADGITLTPRVTAGVYFSGGHTSTWPGILRRADTALYEAKATQAVYALYVEAEAEAEAGAEAERLGNRPSWRLRDENSSHQTVRVRPGRLDGFVDRRVQSPMY